MADPVKTPVKIAVIGSDTSQSKAVIAFNAAMVAAFTAAQAVGQATTPPPTSAPTNIWTDPVTTIFDGTNYIITSAVNYFKFV